MRQKEIDEVLAAAGDFDSFQISNRGDNVYLWRRYYATYSPPDYYLELAKLTDEEIKYCLENNVDDRR